MTGECRTRNVSGRQRKACFAPCPSSRPALQSLSRFTEAEVISLLASLARKPAHSVRQAERSRIMTVKQCAVAFAMAMALAGLVAPGRARGDDAEEQAVQAMRKLHAYVAGDEGPDARPVIVVRFPVGSSVTDRDLEAL